MERSDRSYIICHMMSTIDGKIDSGVKGEDVLSDFYSLYSELESSLHPQAWLCGRVTSEMFAESVSTPLDTVNGELTAGDFRSSSTESNHLIVIDRKGILRWKESTLTFGDGTRHGLVVAVSSMTPKEYLAYLQKKDISYIMSGDEELDFSLLVQKLKKDFLVDRLLLEGGAHLNGSMMSEDLVDEISLLVTPLVLNRTDSLSVFERDTTELDIKKYNLVHVEQKGEAVWLRYKKGSQE